MSRPGVGAREAQRRHHRLGPGVGETHQLGGRHHPRDALGDAVFTLGGQRKHATDLHALACRRIHARIGVAEDRRTVAHAIVDVDVAVEVGDAGPAPLLHVDRAFLAPEAEIGGDTERQALQGALEVGVVLGKGSGHGSSPAGQNPQRVPQLTITVDRRLYDHIIFWRRIIRSYTPADVSHEFHRRPPGRVRRQPHAALTARLGLQPSGDDPARVRADPQTELADRLPRQPDPAVPATT